MNSQFNLKLVIVFLLFVFSIKSKAQNSITLDPNTSQSNTSKVHIQGIGSSAQELKTYSYSGGYGSTIQKIGLLSETTTSDNSFKNTSIVGLSTKSSIENTGIMGIAFGESNSTNSGGRFYGSGNTTNAIFGIYSGVHNAGNGPIFGGYFKTNSISNKSLARFGLYVDNSSIENDTTRATVRNGLYVNTSGNLFPNNTLLGILSEIWTSQNDTITYNNISKAIVGSSYTKNKQMNIGIEGTATNKGIGDSYAGFFSTNYSGVSTANGNRTGIQVNVISSNLDTAMIKSRIGIYTKVNGHSQYDNIAIYAENNNFGDTLTAISRIGVNSNVGGKSYIENVAYKASSYSNSTNNAIGVLSTASNNSTSTGELYGIKSTSIQNSIQDNSEKKTYGGYFSAISNSSNNNNSLYGIYTVASSPYYYTSNSSPLMGIYANAYSYANNDARGVYAFSYGSNTSTGSIKGTSSIAYCENINNLSPVYGIYSEASGYSGGTKYGIFSTANGTGTLYAGYFNGKVHINGTLSKSGGTFKIDHPLEPENKYLNHSFVESPEMKNIYDGVTTTDSEGNATVKLPNYFEALNINFRYQLTCIGQFAQAIILEEIKEGTFKIKTDKPNVKVSWQVTGIRNDIWAQKNPILVEEEKRGDEKGKYLNPSLYNKAINYGIGVEDVIDNKIESEIQKNSNYIKQHNSAKTDEKTNQSN